MVGFGGAGMIFWMVIFWIVVVGLALWLLGRLFPGTGERPCSGEPIFNGMVNGRSRSILDLLNERYARGEITREEYHELRRDVLG